MLKDDINSLEGMLTRISKFLYYTLFEYKSGMKIKQAGAELYQAQYMIRLVWWLRLPLSLIAAKYK